MLNEEKLDNFIGGLPEDVRDTAEKLISSYADRRVTQGVETYKKNNQQQQTQQVTEQQVKTPQKVTVDDLVKREAMLDLREKAIVTAIEKGIPPAIALKMVEKDEETTNTNLDSLFEFAESERRKGLEKALAQNTHRTQSGDDEPFMSEQLIEKHKMDPAWLLAHEKDIKAFRRGNKSGWFK